MTIRILQRGCFMLRAAAAVCCCLSIISPASASQSQGSGPPSPGASIRVTRDQPVLLKADQMDYDSANKVVIAEGHVEVSQNDTIMLADRLTYDQKNNLVFAQGNVSVLEPSGNVYFADDVELSDNMKEGVEKNIRSRFTDNSLFAANEAERINDNVTILHQAVYSPCAIVCDDGTHKPPLWEIRADKATLDRGEQEIYFHDVTFDVLNQPVMYTPYFSQAMPGADNKSGILTPTFRRDGNLGAVAELPAYWAISPEKDLTLTPMYASKVSPVAIGQYRERWDNGQMRLDASITDTGNIDPLGNPIPGSMFRGHIFADGAWSFTDQWQSGFDIRRTTDETYLRVYGFNNDPLLTSRLYGEGFNFTGGDSRSYVVAQTLAFQGLEQVDDPHTSPVVLPAIDMNYQSQPVFWNSRFDFTGDAMSLTRSVGDDSRRLSTTGGWTLPYVTDSGQVFSLKAQMRMDGYDVNSLALANGTLFSGDEGRVIPQTSLEWRYPVISRLDTSSVMVEPVVQAIASPNTGNMVKIPNEDSSTPEFSDINLFSSDRFPGFDRVETGPRLNYGVRSEMQVMGDKYVNALLGQSYRTDNDPLFPLSSDPRSHLSDYVGRLGMDYAPLSLDYRFRLDKDNYTLTHNELQSTLAFSRFSVGATYLELHDDPVLGDKEGITPNGSVKLTDHWTLNAGAFRDLLLARWSYNSVGLVYQDECITLNTVAGHNYATDRDLRASTNFQVQVILKNLN